MAALLLVFSACKKYEVQYEGPYSDSGSQASIEYDYEILFVQSGKVFLLDRTLQSVKQLPNTSSDVKLASINYAHDKIACWTPGQDIELFDSSGVKLGTVDNTANVDWFDWHANNETLYFLKAGKIGLYGPNVEVADSDLNDVFPFGATEKQLTCATVNPDGSVVFTYRYYAWPDYVNQVAQRWATSSGFSDQVSYLYSNNLARWLRSTEDGGTHAIGLEDGSPYRINLYTNNNVFDWGTGGFLAYKQNSSNYVSTYNDKIYIQPLGLEYLIGFEPLTALDW